MKRVVNADTGAHPFVKDPSALASSIADSLVDFLDWADGCDNLSDYLDGSDMEHLQKSLDALYFFAQSYATDNPDTHQR